MDTQGESEISDALEVMEVYNKLFAVMDDAISWRMEKDFTFTVSVAMEEDENMSYIEMVKYMDEYLEAFI